jgi:hypothetical protein
MKDKLNFKDKTSLKISLIDPELYKKMSGNIVFSFPPRGKCKVVNIYVDPSTSKLIVEYDDIPIS